MSPDSRRLRAALGHFATGIIIVTGRTNAGERIGMTMNSFNSVSLDPPLVLFSIRKDALSLVNWQRSSYCAINVLSEDQEELSNLFARSEAEKWKGITPVFGKTGVPLLPDVLVAFECEAYARYDGGDHEIFVSRVVEIHDGHVKHGKPILFFDGRYRQLANVGTAHEPPSDIYGW